MIGKITVYTKIYKSSKTGRRTYLENDSKYILLEPVINWFYDNNKGLAKHLNGELIPYVDKIQYVCENGVLRFDVFFKENYDENDTVIYKEYDYELHGSRENIYSLKSAVCKYILGQISDGWGENGIYILDNNTCKVFLANCENTLYERDYKKSHELAIKHNDEFSGFEKYPAYKPIIYNKNCENCKHCTISEDFGIDCPYWRNQYLQNCSHYEENKIS